MKTTVDLPDSLLRQARATAARERITLNEPLTEALRKRVAAPSAANTGKPWMKAFGGLRHLRTETRPIEAFIKHDSGSGGRLCWSATR